MTPLSVSSRFLLRGIWMRPEVLGARYSWKLDELTIHLVLPKGPTDFREPDHTEEPVVEAWVPTTGNGGPPGGVIVNLVKTEVHFDGSLCAAEKSRAIQAGEQGDSQILDAFGRRAQSECERAHVAAQELLHRWLSHVRTTTDQPWLGISAEPPTQHGRCWLEDREAGVRLIQLGPLQSATVRLGTPLLSLGHLQRVRGLVDARQDPGPADSLLADARFLVREAEVVDVQRAVLLAAMACEIKAKEAMLDNVDPSDAELLQLVLRRISNLPALLDEPLHAAFGVSLRKADSALFRKISRLAECRNTIVHRGDKVDDNEAWTLVVAAKSLFEWLNSLKARPATDT